MSDTPTGSDGAEAMLIDLVPDELSLARAQLDSGLATLAEATLRRRIAWLESDRGTAVGDEIDAARALMAEALWRQGRPLAARAAVDAIRAASPQRRLPTTLIIEAEALAVAGEPDRAAGLVERVIGSVGADEAWRLRGGMASRLTWPLPAELQPAERRPARPPWRASETERSGPVEGDEGTSAERAAAARARLEAARAAYTAGEAGRGDRELSLALRLDSALAADGVELIEPTLGEGPPTERLLLYGDLLRASAREADADAAYDRAARSRS